ncbi:MAG: ABC transporter permease [Rhodospirillaceae bacterium TMED8]|nr:ABC transporter permease [Magnetovibrio sp.]OUT49041.1 MAG: ABC transporter permease [Rhodospirillaceae bacterium TMED8]
MPVRNIFAIFKREFFSYFATPVAYVFIVIFLAMMGSLAFYVGGFFSSNQATLVSFFFYHPWLYLLLIPSISMRLWAEERKTGTVELLLTLPVSTTEAVMGKYFAAWAFAGIALSLTFPMWVTVNILGNPDNGVILASYVGSLVMAGAFLAIGSCVSALTKNQVIAFIVAATICFMFTMSGLELVLNFFRLWAPDLLIETIASMSFLSHFRAIAKGVIDFRDVVFFGSLISFFLFANVVVIDAKKGA